MIVATDLVGQAEHGYNSPVWLVTDDRRWPKRSCGWCRLIDDLPEVNRDNATAAWRDYAEVILCADREEMAADGVGRYAPEHLTVQARDLDWWLGRLQLLWLAVSGRGDHRGLRRQGIGHQPRPAHLGRGQLYTGGLSVHKYMKIVTWQRATKEGAKPVAEATARIARLEGMEGHARTADIRLKQVLPGRNLRS